MKNIGNSCYINSVLQMLAAIPGFQRHLCTMQETFTHRHSNGAASIGGGSSSAAMSSSSFKGQSPPLLAGLCTLLTSVLNTPSGSSLGPMDITVLRSHFQAPFSAKQQQDAEEFLTYILDYLETSCGYKPFTAWIDILQGGVTGSIRCDTCAHVTSKVDPFMVLKIKFAFSSCKTVVNMTDLLAYNFAPARLVGENRFECFPCGESMQNATKTSFFSSSCPDCIQPCYPPTLLLSFARFNLNVYTGARTKISTPVNFGHTLQFRDNLIYDLIGIIIHNGNTDVSGHYYAYLRLANGVGLGNSWFVVNDTVVLPVSDDEVDIMCTGRHNLGVTPYMLSYQCRQSTPSSSAPRCACRQTV
jgi:uncharacterized UBP type Zn finger protein